VASLLNKTGCCGSVIRVNTNAIPNYSFRPENFKELVLKHKPVLDMSTSICNGKIFKRNINFWQPSVSVGLTSSLQIKLAHTDVLKVPDFSDVRHNSLKESNARREDSDVERRMFSYTMLFGASLVGAMVTKDIVRTLLETMTPNAKTLAEASLEVDIGSIPEGKNVVFKWRNKPLFVKHRTAEDIEREAAVPLSELRDPQSDADRVQKPEWLILVGICTHLGCVPIANAGDYGGYYCPCHGSHYDGSGRIRRGPAPLNLEIPEYKFIQDTTIVVG